MTTAKAVTGGMSADEARAFLLQAGVTGLQHAAGYVAREEVFLEHDEPIGGAILYDYSGHKAQTIHALSRFVRGYGWIAGGSVLHFVHGEKVGYGDIDVFCVSQAAYETLCDCFQDYITETSKRSCVAESAMFGLGEKDRYRLDRSLNLVTPTEGEDWTHPAAILRGFDLSCGAVAIIEPGLAYTLHREDVLEKRINYIGNARNPVKFWRRVMKYYSRGCILGGDFFTDLINDSNTRELVYMAQDMYNMGTRKRDIDSELLWACWAVNDYESDGTEHETDSVYEYDEGWY